MKHPLSILLSGLVVSGLSGCASFDKWTQFEEEQTEQKIEEVEMLADNPDEQLEQSSGVSFQQRYRKRLLENQSSLVNRAQKVNQNSRDINYFARGLMQDLVGNLQYVNGRTPVAISSFVFLDGSYEYADIVGKQLSESLMHEVHKFGIPLVDFKATEFIRVTPNGDFILSQDFLDLDGDLPIKYVITGTMVKHVSGYLVNARAIGLESKAVVGTAQAILPTSVVNSLISSDVSKGVELMSGVQ
ncbi:MAG: hypothetical protein HWE10_12265 [Gammaproteobacteria bacterium]|nr:hypothetical protein [Gammaproteobacteria bacterium]